MSLSVLNFIVCAIGGFLCLWVLITKKTDTSHWARLFFICSIGMAFTVWLISGMVNQPFIKGENIIGRACTTLAVAFAYFEMYKNDKK